MIESTHRGHEFEHLKSVYEKHVVMVKTEAKGLTKRLRELALLLHAVDTNIERVRKSKEEKSQEILLVVERMQAKLEDELKMKMTSLHKQRGAITQEVEYLESMHVELKRQLSSSARSSLIAKTPDLLQMLKEVHEKPVASYTGVLIAPDFASEIVPDYDAAVFTLQNYSVLKESSEVVYSDSLKSNGLTWRLKVYPNGNGLVRGAYLSVFLEMLKGLQDSSKYYYRVELVNHRSPNLCVVREFASDFESGECWGYNRFYRIDLLEEEGYLDPDTDTLVLRFFVRAENYSQQCRDQKAYIAYLEQSRAGALEQIAELKQQLRDDRGSVLNSNENPLAMMGEDEGTKEPNSGDRSSQWDQDSSSEELGTSRLIGHEDEETKSLEDLSLAVTEARKDLALMFKEYMISPEDVSDDKSEWSEDVPEFQDAMSHEALDDDIENSSRNWQSTTAERESLGKSLAVKTDSSV
jgi:tripartite motif-containing protein 37